MNAMKTLFLILAVICASVVVARDLKGPKSTKSPTLKSTKGPKMSKKTKSPSAKGSKLSTKSPTLKSTKAPTTKSTKSSSKGGGGGGTTFLNIGTVNFDDLVDDTDIGVFKGLTWTGFIASDTNPPAPSAPLAATISNTSPTITAPANSVFSLVSAQIAGAANTDPLTVTGFDVNGVQTATTVIDFLTTYAVYDLSAFTNINSVTFDFSGTPAAIDDLIFA